MRSIKFDKRYKRYNAMNNIKFIADVNVEKAIVDYLLEEGYDVKWIPDYNREMLDEDLLELAKVEGRILITNDKDFGEIVFFQKSLSLGIILLRIKGQKVEVKLKLIKELFQNYRNKLLNNFVIITDKKLRFIPLEDER
jgi:predicted nuclease of predicted toxin-antitoxin system